MNENKQKILDMINEGKVSAADGARLLECLSDTEKEEKAQAQEMARRTKGRKLRVEVNGVESGKNLNVNVSLPLALARYAGNIVTQFVPDSAGDSVKDRVLQGLDIGEIVDVLEELEGDIVNVDVQEEEENTDMKVRVYVE